MKILAFSDNHGYLPKIKNSYDVICCSGDFSPLSLQRNYMDMMCWFHDEFIPWMYNLPCKHFVFIAGNHDFVCENPNFIQDFDSQKVWVNGKEKPQIHYLQNSYCEIDGKLFFGCPYSDIPHWAFSITTKDEFGYKLIMPNTDVLLVHQPPLIEDIGVSTFNNGRKVNFGSQKLLKQIEEKKPKYVFCGHIHSGNHNKITYNDTILYNVSIKGETYSVDYKPLEIEI